MGYDIITTKKEVKIMPRWTNTDRTPLAILRANVGLSRTQASVLLDVALNTLGRYETGQSELPLDVAEDMAVLYKIPFDDIRTAYAATKRQSKRSPQLKQLNLQRKVIAL